VLLFDGSLLKGRGKRAVRPATFTFLGFVHYLKEGRSGRLTVARRPSVKARERFIRKANEWLRAHLHVPVREQQAQLARMLNGHYQYFGLHHCLHALNTVRLRVQRLWFWALRRRSQKATRRCDWATLNTRPWFKLSLPRLTQAWV